MISEAPRDLAIDTAIAVLHTLKSELSAPAHQAIAPSLFASTSSVAHIRAASTTTPPTPMAQDPAECLREMASAWRSAYSISAAVFVRRILASPYSDSLNDALAVVDKTGDPFTINEDLIQALLVGLQPPNDTTPNAELESRLRFCLRGVHCHSDSTVGATG